MQKTKNKKKPTAPKVPDAVVVKTSSKGVALQDKPKPKKPRKKKAGEK